MNKDKMRLAMYHLSVYNPSSRRIRRVGEEKCWELAGPVNPYREEEFDLRWLRAYHPTMREYWDPRYLPNKDENK